jgi:hypothetical protein
VLASQRIQVPVCYKPIYEEMIAKIDAETHLWESLSAQDIVERYCNIMHKHSSSGEKR